MWAKAGNSIEPVLSAYSKIETKPHSLCQASLLQPAPANKSLESVAQPQVLGTLFGPASSTLEGHKSSAGLALTSSYAR